MPPRHCPHQSTAPVTEKCKKIFKNHYNSILTPKLTKKKVLESSRQNLSIHTKFAPKTRYKKVRKKFKVCSLCFFFFFKLKHKKHHTWLRYQCNNFMVRSGNKQYLLVEVQISMLRQKSDNKWSLFLLVYNTNTLSLVAWMIHKC